MKRRVRTRPSRLRRLQHHAEQGVETQRNHGQRRPEQQRRHHRPEAAVRAVSSPALLLLLVLDLFLRLLIPGYEDIFAFILDAVILFIINILIIVVLVGGIAHKCVFGDGLGVCK